MSFYLLDAAGPLLILGPMILFMVLCVLLEALPMKMMRYVPFGRAMALALFVNIVTLILGFVLVPFFGDHVFGEDTGINNPLIFLELGLYYVITVVVEALLLKLFVRSKSWAETFKVSAVMNLVTYIVLTVMLFFFND